MILIDTSTSLQSFDVEKQNEDQEYNINLPLSTENTVLEKSCGLLDLRIQIILTMLLR